MYHDVTPKDSRDTKGRAGDDGAEDASAHRDGDGKDKKERVLHTRIPVVLEQELKRFAENLRIPVSNLVRTILEDALDVADAASENVEARLMSAAKQLEHERERLKARVKLNPLRGVFAFQEVTLAQATMCARCKKDLAAGSRAFLGLVDDDGQRARGGRPRVFVCEACLPGAPPPA